MCAACGVGICSNGRSHIPGQHIALLILRKSHNARFPPAIPSAWMSYVSGYIRVLRTVEGHYKILPTRAVLRSVKTFGAESMRDHESFTFHVQPLVPIFKSCRYVNFPGEIAAVCSNIKPALRLIVVRSPAAETCSQGLSDKPVSVDVVI
jgi:hypothetical protein